MRPPPPPSSKYQIIKRGVSAKGAPDPDKQGSNFIMVRMVRQGVCGGHLKQDSGFINGKGWWIVEGREEKRRRAERGREKEERRK